MTFCVWWFSRFNKFPKIKSFLCYTPPKCDVGDMVILDSDKVLSQNVFTDIPFSMFGKLQLSCKNQPMALTRFSIRSSLLFHLLIYNDIERYRKICLIANTCCSATYREKSSQVSDVSCIWYREIVYVANDMTFIWVYFPKFTESLNK